MATTRTTTAHRDGFKVPCPDCGAIEGLRVVAHNLAIECGECGETIAPAALRRLIDDAEALLRWVESAATL